MSESNGLVSVPGSQKKPLPNAQIVGDVSADEQFTVTVRVRARRPVVPETNASPNLSERKYTTRSEHAAVHGADPADLAKVVAFAAQHGLTVVESSEAKRAVILSGTASAFGGAFGVELKMYDHPSGAYRGRSGEIYVPAELKDIVTGVFGLDNRTFAKPHHRHGGTWTEQAVAVAAGEAGVTAHAAATAAPRALLPTEVAKLYNFPSELDGTGQTIAILELGGGFRPDEVNKYFSTVLNIKTPRVSVASFPASGPNHPTSHPERPTNPDGEVMLDIQVAGGVAPGANIVVYFGRDASDNSFLQVLSAAVHDNVNKPHVISISWGGPEAAAAQQFQNAFNEILAEAIGMGITVCAAAGDHGSADFPANDPRDPWDGKAHVDFPASSPSITACGGTLLVGSGNTITSESVWHSGQNLGTGGGVSRVFALPDYQAQAGVPRAKNPDGAIMRGVPDVAGNADPASGFRILVDNVRLIDGGTSAVAPLWSGLVALMNQSIGTPLGFLNPLLYKLAPATGALNDITTGDNGDYSAATGWDPCTGLGTPNGRKLLAALTPNPAPPVPQTA